MSARVRENVAWVVPAAAATAAIAKLGLVYFGSNDYLFEALPAVNALVHGHLGGFFARAPIYGGSLLERAPFAFAPALWGGGELAVYRMLALPCLLACPALGLWLVARMRAGGQKRYVCALALALCVANPLMLLALQVGHPEELLGGALCVTAVLLAARGHAAWAGLALGVAIANKEWAVLALGPVLLALPAKRILCATIVGAVGGTLLAPFELFAPGGFQAGMHVVANPGSAIFQPWQLWWFLGRHEPGHIVYGLFGTKHGFRTAPGWVGIVGHPLIVGLVLPLTLAAWFRLRGSERAAVSPATNERLREGAALLLLGLLLALRFMLDPLDYMYYALPCVLALTAWETLALRRPPLFAVAVTAAMWVAQHWTVSLSPDAQAAFFAAWSVPLAIALAVELYGPAVRLRARTASLGAASPPASLDLGVQP
ncbi:MAG: hypothetical protein ACRDK4_09440 [Solirubrobacteraceae bacterium]